MHAPNLVSSGAFGITMCSIPRTDIVASYDIAQRPGNDLTNFLFFY